MDFYYAKYQNETQKNGNWKRTMIDNPVGELVVIANTPEEAAKKMEAICASKDNKHRKTLTSEVKRCKGLDIVYTNGPHIYPILH